MSNTWLYVTALALSWLLLAFLVWAVIHGGKRKKTPGTKGE